MKKLPNRLIFMTPCQTSIVDTGKFTAKGLSQAQEKMFILKQIIGNNDLKMSIVFDKRLKGSRLLANLIKKQHSNATVCSIEQNMFLDPTLIKADKATTLVEEYSSFDVIIFVTCVPFCYHTPRYLGVPDDNLISPNEYSAVELDDRLNLTHHHLVVSE